MSHPPPPAVAASAAAVKPPQNTGGNFRWTICGLLFFSVAVNYIDRLVIGILKGPMSEKLGWSDADYGHITAAFSFAYAFGYLSGGRLMDRWGVKKGLPIFSASSLRYAPELTEFVADEKHGKTVGALAYGPAPLFDFRRPVYSA